MSSGQARFSGAHLGHTDSTISKGDGVVGLVGGNMDEQLRLALEHWRRVSGRVRMERVKPSK